MINAKELRLWNWVLVNGVPTQIQGIAQDGSGNYGYNMFYGGMPDFYSCEPIPLTPEILEAAGFEWLYNDVYNSNEHPEYSVEKEDDEWIFTQLDSNKSITLKALSNLHQLQNVYHALTGKELTINLHAAV